MVCVIGLGYMSLPLAQEFAKSLKVIGLDIDHQKVDQLGATNQSNLNLTTHLKERIQASSGTNCERVKAGLYEPGE